jgi:hypothetical protein
MIRTLLSYYILGKFVPNTDKAGSTPPFYFATMAILAMLIATSLAILIGLSVIVGECCLAYLAFKYLTETLQYTETCGWLVIVGAFFLQAIIILAIVLGKIESTRRSVRQEQSKLPRVISEFVKGFKQS